MDVGYASAMQRWTKVRPPLRHNTVTITLLSARERRLQTAVGNRGNPLGEGLACGQKWITLDQCQYLQGYKRVITDAYSVVLSTSPFTFMSSSPCSFPLLLWLNASVALNQAEAQRLLRVEGVHNRCC